MNKYLFIILIGLSLTDISCKANQTKAIRPVPVYKTKSFHQVINQATWALKYQIDSGLVIIKDSARVYYNNHSEHSRKKHQHLINKIMRYEKINQVLSDAGSDLYKLAELLIKKAMKENESAQQFLEKQSYIRVVLKSLNECQRYLQDKYPQYLEHSNSLSHRYLKTLPDKLKKRLSKNPVNGFIEYYFSNASKQEAIKTVYLLELQFFQEAWDIFQKILKE